MFVEEADAAEEMVFDLAKIAVEIEAEAREGTHGVGQKAFAAGLVDRWAHGVDDFDAEALVCGGDGGSETGGACAYDEDVRLRWWSANWHGNAESSEDRTPLG